MEEKNKFKVILGKLNYKTEKQKKAIVKLLFLSGSFDYDFFKQTINYVRGVNKKEKIKKDFIKPILEKAELNKITEFVKFDKNFKYEEFCDIFNKLGLTKKEILDWYVVSTQILWFNRKPNQERWDVQSLKWLDKYSKLASGAIKNTGIKDEVKPSKKKYDVVMVLGASKSRMEKRLDYLNKLLNEEKLNIKNSEIYFLGGERTITPRIDGGVDFIRELAEKYNKQIKSINKEKQTIEWEDEKNTITEYHLFEYLRTTKFSNLKNIISVNTPRGNKARPNTQDTVKYTLEKYLKDFKNENLNVLVVSSQPNVQAQSYAVKDVLNDKTGIMYETCGCSAENNSSKSCIMPLAGRAFGAYPYLVNDMSLKADRKKVSYQQELYGTIVEKQQSGIVL